jgi:hypothetical protein
VGTRCGQKVFDRHFVDISTERERPPTLDERKTFDQVFAAIGLTPKQRKGRQR